MECTELMWNCVLEKLWKPKICRMNEVSYQDSEVFWSKKTEPKALDILCHVWAKQWNAGLQYSLKPSRITFHFVAASTFTLTEAFSYTWQQPVCSPLRAGEICSQNLKSEKVMEPNPSIESAWKFDLGKSDDYGS